MLKENKLALEMDKHWTDSEPGAFAEAGTKTWSCNKVSTCVSEECGAQRVGSAGPGHHTMS